MTPQELIDMPGCGKAEEYMRKVGKWAISPKEKLEDLICKLEMSLDDAQLAMSDIEDVWRELDT